MLVSGLVVTSLKPEVGLARIRHPTVVAPHVLVIPRKLSCVIRNRVRLMGYGGYGRRMGHVPYVEVRMEYENVHGCVIRRLRKMVG